MGQNGVTIMSCKYAMESNNTKTDNIIVVEEIKVKSFLHNAYLSCIK